MLTVFLFFLSLVGIRKVKQQVNKSKQCNNLVYQQTFSWSHNLPCVILLFVLNQLYFVNASTNHQSNLFEKSSAERTIIPSEIQTNSVISDLGHKNITEPFENVHERLKEKNTNINSERSKRSSSSNDLTSTAETPYCTCAPPNTNSKMEELQIKTKQLVADIHKLLSLSTLSNDIKERISSLEDILKGIGEFIKSKSRDFELNCSNCAQDIISLINKIREDVDAISSMGAEEERYQKELKIREECINAVNRLDFESAEIKLNEIENEDNIHFIVKQMYKNSTENFNRVLRFENAIQNVRKRFLVLKALSHELDNHGHNNIYRYIALLKALRRKPCFSSILEKEEAESFEATLRRSIKDILKEKLRNMLNNNCTTNAELKYLGYTVFSMEQELFGESIKEAVGDPFEFAVETKNLLSCLGSLYDFSMMQLRIYEAIIEHMKSNNSLYKDDVFSLAHRLRLYSEPHNSPHLFHEERDYAIRLKMMLPHVVRLLMFSPKVGLKNKYYNEYLYAAANNLIFSSKRRRVFTWVPNDPTFNESEWILEYNQTTNCFQIKNKHYNEYLYPAYSDVKYDNERRRVFTWIPKDSVDDEQFPWKIELDRDSEDSIHIKSVYYNEYLYADIKYDGNRRQVFTYIPGSKTRESLWEVVSL